jgi:hypothetical protein
VLAIADLLTTGIGIALGAQEGNLVPVFQLGHLSFAGLVAVKLNYCSVAAGVLALTARSYVWRARVLALLCCGSAGVFVGHNLYWLPRSEWCSRPPSTFSRSGTDRPR